MILTRISAVVLVFCLYFAPWVVSARTMAKGTSGSEQDFRMTYDLGASAGTYGGQSYSEINLGLNWYFADWMAWRNALFSRMGKDQNTQGLDTSLRFEYNTQGEKTGFKAFAGPGYRFASRSMSAVFAEGGVIGRIGSLSLGFGVKTMIFNSPGTDALGDTLPKQDTSYFFILGGGGVL